MESRRNRLIVVLCLLVSCKLIETKGLCQFAEMFPSKGAESCFGHAKPAEDKEPEKTQETPEPIVLEQERECYYHEGGFLITDGDTYVNDDCSERCTCSNNQLRCDSTYECSPNATCRVRDDVRQCYCNDGYAGDGETCKLYIDCYDAYQAGHRQDGFFIILPYGWPGSPFIAWCDMTTTGGGWTILQRRLRTGSFGDRNWQYYKDGFGLEPPSDRYWLGNEKIFYLTNQRNYTLRVDLVSSGGATTYQEYSLFKIANERDNYRLIEFGSSSGTAGDGMNGTIGCQFSTKDRDNDGCDDIDCSKHHGTRGWWYSNKLCKECCNRNEPTCFQSITCNKRCTRANLNGGYGNETAGGFFWDGVDNIVSTEMKIRPVKESVQ